VIALTAVPFAPEHKGMVSGFACGNEPWAREAEAWIKGKLKRDGVYEAMKQGVRAWLFFTPNDALVGFGSLGTAKMHYPYEVPKAKLVNLIPSLAVHRDFQGGPAGAAPGERFSDQIVDFLITEARTTALLPVLLLFVDRDNARAMHVYQRAGFIHWPERPSDYDQGRNPCRMIVSLVDNPSE